MPTSTTLRYVDPTHSAGLMSTYASATSALATATGRMDFISNSRLARGAHASLAIISAESVNATATNTQVGAKATLAIFENTVNLLALAREESQYAFRLNRPSNIIYFSIFTLLFLYFLGAVYKSRYHWFNICFVCGYALEFCGFLGRILGFVDDKNSSSFILQYVALTISPAFIMGGVYFLFAQMVVITSPRYSVLKPMWYSYFFITFDVVSLLIQATGGGMASAETNQQKSSAPGANVMITGIAVQIFAMSIFLVFWFQFLIRLYFKDVNYFDGNNFSKKKSFKNFMLLLFNTPSTKEHKDRLDSSYNPQYQYIRKRKLFNYYPLAISLAVIVIYIRCVYRVVELAQGWRGYLIDHEVYLMVLDALMIAIAGIIFVPFHPLIVFGSELVIKVKDIKNQTRMQRGEPISTPSSEDNASVNSQTNMEKQYVV